MKSRKSREPSVRMWRGYGVVSPKGLFLEAWSARSEYVVNQLRERPKGSRLVLITARLEKISVGQFRTDRSNSELGFVEPPKEHSTVRLRKTASKASKRPLSGGRRRGT